MADRDQQAHPVVTAALELDASVTALRALADQIAVARDAMFELVDEIAFAEVPRVEDPGSDLPARARLLARGFKLEAPERLAIGIAEEVSRLLGS